MTITPEALFALAAVIVLLINAWFRKSLLSVGLALFALAFMLHAGVRVAT